MSYLGQNAQIGNVRGYCRAPVAYRHIGRHIHAPTGSCQSGLTTVRVAGRHARDPAPCMVIRPRRGREVGWAERISLAVACRRVRMVALA